MFPDYIDKSLLPHKPGIYMYKNAAGEVIYVGKAVDLYSRVSSYFNNQYHDPKTSALVQNIHGLETIIVESELQALILEANLIKRFLPLYNIMLKDDKDYIYIGVTNEVFPKIVTARKQDLKELKKFFGPFPSAGTVRTTLKRLRRVFPWCSNPPGPKNKTYRPCFYFHIKLCPGACVGIIEKEDYNRIINMFNKFMDGGGIELQQELMTQMNKLATQEQFEEASRIKKVFNGVTYLLQPTSISQYLSNPNFLENQNQQAISELQKVLALTYIPHRIECYDISNFQGTDATGSMVVLTNGEIDKSQYRRFKIKISGKPNDFAMHAEMMRRRLKNDWPLPQLFLIDGGRGQVHASQSELIKAGINIPIFGIAKREEWLYPPEGEPIKLSKRSLALRLVQKIRDESHRFAITYHRKLRSRSFGLKN